MRYATKQRFVPGGGNVWCIGVSRDGTKMVVGMNGGLVYKSTDSGVTWSETAAPSYGWNKVAISNDGQYIFAQGNSNYVHVSSNGGTSFTQKTTNVQQNNNQLVCSATGQYVYLGGGAFGAGYVTVSTDYGATWSQKSATGTAVKQALACSSDGRYVVTGAASAAVYTSADFGANWTTRTNAGNRSWYGGNISDDGTKVALAVYNVGIFVSTDSGANWAQKANNNYWIGLVGNGDGSKLIAYGAQTTNPGIFEFWTSGDAGLNWTKRTLGNMQDQFGQQSNGNAASDTAGNFMVAVPHQFLKQSTDNGLNWVSLDANFDVGKQFSTFTVSGDGKVGYINEYPASRLHISTDGLQNWAYTDPVRRAVVATNYDGSKALGIEFATTVYSGGTSTNYPTVSTDTGQTWTTITGAGSREYGDGCMSDDGVKMYLTANNLIVNSMNTGSTWTAVTVAPSGQWMNDVACSSDGSKVYTCYSGPGYIYTSTNSGANWTQRTGAGNDNWYAVDCSADGSIVYAAVDPGPIKKSVDSGANWTTLTSAGTTRSWSQVLCSADGNRVIAVYYDGSNSMVIICSFNGGTTWTTLYTLSATEYSYSLVGVSNNLRKIAYGVTSLRSGDLVENKLVFMV